MTTNGFVSTRPLRRFLLAWAAATGDPPEVIAQGFALDWGLVDALLGGEAPRMIPLDRALASCERLRLAPDAMWPTLCGPASWPTEPLEDTVEPLWRLLASSDTREPPAFACRAQA